MAVPFPESADPPAKDEDEVDVDDDVWRRIVEAFVAEEATEQVDELDELEE